MKLTILPTILILTSCTGSNEVDEIEKNSSDTSIIATSEILNPDTTATNSLSEIQYSYEAFETPGIGWGYKIFEYGKLFINQPHMPAVQGNKGFSSLEDANKTAEFAISKMQNGIIPPTISTQELDSLGVLD
jgi:hypothetical protein